MIHAESPEKIIGNQTPEVSQVYGFSTPATPQPITPDAEQVTPEHHYTPEWQKTLFHWWHKIALIILILHGLTGLWESLKFMFIEYPELNKALTEHSVESAEVNHLISRAVITVTVTFVSVLFAVRLSKVKETTAHNIDLVLATFLIITTNLIKNFLIQLDLLNLILGILLQ